MLKQRNQIDLDTIKFHVEKQLATSWVTDSVFFASCEDASFQKKAFITSYMKLWISLDHIQELVSHCTFCHFQLSIGTLWDVKCKKMQKCKSAKVQKYKSTKGQKWKNTKLQKCKSESWQRVTAGVRCFSLKAVYKWSLARSQVCLEAALLDRNTQFHTGRCLDRVPNSWAAC